MRVWKAKVRSSFVSDSRVDYLSDKRDGGLRTVCGEPYERSKRRLLRVRGEVNVAKVSVIRPFHKPNGGRVLKDGREGKWLSHDIVEWCC